MYTFELTLRGIAYFDIVLLKTLYKMVTWRVNSSQNTYSIFSYSLQENDTEITHFKEKKKQIEKWETQIKKSNK